MDKITTLRRGVPVGVTPVRPVRGKVRCWKQYRRASVWYLNVLFYCWNSKNDFRPLLCYTNRSTVEKIEETKNKFNVFYLSSFRRVTSSTLLYKIFMCHQLACARPLCNGILFSVQEIVWHHNIIIFLLNAGGKRNSDNSSALRKYLLKIKKKKN